MSLTIVVLITTAVALVAYDIAVVLTLGVRATISHALYSTAQEYPIVSFALGIVFGHLFWPQ